MNPSAYIFQRSFWRGLYSEGNLRYRIGLYMLLVFGHWIGPAYSWEESYVSSLLACSGLRDSPVHGD